MSVKPCFYIFHGDDDHTIRKALAGLREQMGDPSMLDLNTSRFEGGTVSFSELRHACDTIPFLSEKRMVIVSDLFAANPPFLEELLAYLPEVPESTRLFFVESRRLPKNHKAVKAAMGSEKGYVKHFERPQGGKLDRWILDRAKSGGGKMTPRAAHMLAINVGNDLTLLDNEIEKLVLYKGAEPIEVDDVSLMCPYVAEASIFELVDAIGSRHGRTAAQLLHQKLSGGADPSFLFAMVVRQFRLIIQIKELAEAGLKPLDIARELQIHSFVAGKLAQQSHNFTFEQLEQIYAHLLDVDVRVKTGRTDMITALNLLVAAVAL